MGAVDRLIGLASPSAALRRAIRLRTEGRDADAFRLLIVAARAGLADAEYRVARCYLEGSGVPPSRREGVRWLHGAAAHGCIEAQVLLSGLYIQGVAGEASADPATGSAQADRLFAGDLPADPDFEAAGRWARQAAAAGSAEGLALLGYVLTWGPDSLRDLDEAHRCYERSATAGCPQGNLGHALSLARRATDQDGWCQVAVQLRLAADAELPIAIYLLGVLTEQGLGMARDPVRALQFYRRAAELGQRSAQVRWGRALLDGREVGQDAVAGESWLRRAAHAGDPQAAATVGDLYARGGTTPPNYVEAAGWYRRAAEAGHAAAARALGSLYLTGAGVAQDSEEAARWLRLSAEAGDVGSQVDLANLVMQGAGRSEDPARIARWFAQAAASGDPIAAFNVAVCLTTGMGVDRDEQHALAWLRRAADGVAEAQYVYGRMLAEGRGAAPDLDGAREWFARAARAGLPDAEAALAEMMLNGRGGPRSAAGALKLFETAAANGHRGAMFALGALHGGGHDVPVDRTVAQRWFRAAAELGHGHAQLMLGRYLASGVAGEHDPVEGRLWLERAVAQGIADAEPDLAMSPGTLGAVPDRT